MKKLSKLQINAEKLIKNTELLILRGGYTVGACCTCKEEDGTKIETINALTALECSNFCNERNDPPYFGAWGDWSC